MTQQAVEDQIVQTNVQPDGTKLFRMTRANEARGTEAHEIPFILYGASKIVMQQRRDPVTREPLWNPDGSPIMWRNEIGDAIEKAPESDRLYISRGILVTFAYERNYRVEGLDHDADGSVFTTADLYERVVAFARAASGAPVTAQTAGAQFEAAAEEE